MTYSEEQQSKREDSIVSINRLRKEVYDERTLLLEKEEKIHSLKEECEAIRSQISNMDARLEQLENEHEEEFNEKI